MTNQLIKTCKELNECEGMGESDSLLVIPKDDTCTESRMFVATRSIGGDYTVYSDGFAFRDDDFTAIYPYLTAGHFDKWSSAKFLARAGWKSQTELLISWLWEKHTSFNSRATFKACQEIRVNLKEGNHELAYMQAIILLYKIDREAYDKGLEPLLEGK